MQGVSMVRLPGEQGVIAACRVGRATRLMQLPTGGEVCIHHENSLMGARIPYHSFTTPPGRREPLAVSFFPGGHGRQLPLGVSMTVLGYFKRCQCCSSLVRSGSLARSDLPAPPSACAPQLCTWFARSAAAALTSSGHAAGIVGAPYLLLSVCLPKSLMYCRCRENAARSRVHVAKGSESLETLVVIVRALRPRQHQAG